MNDPRCILLMVVKNGGTQTFFKAQITDYMREALHQLSCEGYLEHVGETRQTLTVRISEQSHGERIR